MSRTLEESLSDDGAHAAPALTFVDRSGMLRSRMRYMRAAALVVLLALPFLQSTWYVEGAVHETFEFAGLVCLIACIVGRVWCSAYIGGRKNYELVTAGPFSVVRNPLYVFSFIGVTGIGLLTGMVTVTIAFQLMFIAYHHATVRREEAALHDSYGAAYDAYMARVPRWLPRPRLWKEPERIEVRPRFLYLTLRDVGWIVLLYPLVEGFDRLQETGILPVLLHLP